MTSYLLDANVLIEAKNRYFRFEFCPAFWDWLTLEIQRNKIATVVGVADELLRQEDELAEWVSQQIPDFLIILNSSAQLVRRKITDWAGTQNYFDSAIQEFTECADSELIAQAIEGKCTIVTHEKIEKTRKKVKIPNVCSHFGVSYIDTFELLTKESAKFVLEASSSKIN